MGKGYDEVSVIRVLNRNSAIKVNGKVIEIAKNATTVGNGTLGKIDYLCNYCGYTRLFGSSANAAVAKPTKKKKITREDKKEIKQVKLVKAKPSKILKGK